MQRAEAEQFARRGEEDDAGKDRSCGGDHPPQGRIGSCERGKNGRAKRPVHEDKAEIGRNQRRKRQCPRIWFRQVLAQGHDEETGDESQIKSSPNKIIADGSDWRFLNELKRELKA